MSISSIPSQLKVHLWVKAGGRCQYDGCNELLWRDRVSFAEMNKAYIAHIIADKPGGPRGEAKLSRELADDISNLMLLCDTHHRKIDAKNNLVIYSVERLKKMKSNHEARIELLTSIHPEKKSEILLYGANIGAQTAPVTYSSAIAAMVPHRYPGSSQGLTLGMKNSSFQDKDERFWQIESEHLKNVFSRDVKPRLADGSIGHLSVFGLAPQPLLILLGSLMSDIPDVDVYQYRREPVQTWSWADENPEDSEELKFDFIIERPKSCEHPPALILSLSATIIRDRISKVMDKGQFSPWVITLENPHNDFLRSREQLSRFRQKMRALLNEIKASHGEKSLIHVFPAVPVSIAIEIGRVLMPKADLPLRIYDQNMALGRFVHAFDLS